MAQDVIPSIAERYHVSVDAVRQLERALRATGGRQAQFDHPDLGGRGQWMPGMCMIERMDDEQICARIKGLCDEIAAIVTGSETSAPAALARDPDTGAASGCSPLSAGESWWPASYGTAATEGQQNGVRYAYFPAKNRLLIQVGARIEAYNTTGRQITGVSQQQGHSHTLTFTGPSGHVDLDALERVDLV